MNLYGDPRLPQRFWSKVIYSEDGCWLWKASKNAGYGAFGWKGKTPNAHRVLYLELLGPIPDGYVVDHLCHGADQDCKGGNGCLHRSCVRPDHLEPVSQEENKARGRSPLANFSRQTHCKNGHPLEGENLWMDHGGRVCRVCRLETNKRWRESNPDKLKASQRKSRENWTEEQRQRHNAAVQRYQVSKRSTTNVRDTA